MYTVLLEYFAGEKPLRMSQISRKFDPLRSNYILRTGKDRVYLLVIMRILLDQPLQNSQMFDARKAF